ncbi:MAG: hypothetical protein GEV28_06120 [Actinophytocola sp.]|uniref:helicase-associated domain-containing protein n=1 Tax=Actinophytocola sp. TaxID=1872138 RepID=UPI0013223EF5|nr:helicase-associated domain-containing protein [Actinophytocola sp.]MPZ79986.1 hypothetical protein [Actinophytocola sp.]
MDAAPFAVYLSELDDEALTRLLVARPDVRIEPVPRGFPQLAQRLGGADSIVAALRTLTRDTVVVGQAIAVLGEAASLPAVARLLGAPEQAVRDEVTQLRDRGLAWTSSGMLHLPERLQAHWTAELGGGRPVAKMATTVLAEELRVAASALGVAADGLRKPELIARLTEAMADLRSLVEVIAGLPGPARARLEQLRQGGFGIMFGFVDPRRRGTDPTDLLLEAGLVLRPNRQVEVPREVAVAAWLAEHENRLTGRPEVAAAGTAADAVRPTAQAAAREVVRGLSMLLDEAGRTPITALKKGGVGPRQRSRLAKRLSSPDDVLVLWIDLAYAAGLLGEVDGGYAPTDAYPDWRAAEPSLQWAAVASAWHALEHAPLMREIDGDKEHPPPLTLMSAAGAMRRAMLRAARTGLSMRGAGAEIDWFFPLHGYDPEARDEKIAAAVREAELLGVTAGDRVSELGEELLAAIDDADAADDEAGDDVVAEAARRCASLLPGVDCGVILQSDLTAVVSGQPSPAVSRLLVTMAVNETRDNAGIWRFTPASLRAALDAGWTAPELLAELAAIAHRAVPQPLEYLITDAARRHGQVRVRGMRSCVVADEALITEILNTRSLADLQLGRVAPTVVSSPFDLDHVLARLRAAGLSPVAEDSSGMTIIENRQEHRAKNNRITTAKRTKSRLTAAELVGRLIADPHGEHPPMASTSATFELLAQLNRHLDDAELALLSHAVDHKDDVLISYRDKNGSPTVRQIQPNQIFGRWLDSWCYLRNADREFTIANIESVAPPH